MAVSAGCSEYWFMLSLSSLWRGAHMAAGFATSTFVLLPVPCIETGRNEGNSLPFVCDARMRRPPLLYLVLLLLNFQTCTAPCVVHPPAARPHWGKNNNRAFANDRCPVSAASTGQVVLLLEAVHTCSHALVTTPYEAIGAGTTLTP